MDVDEAEKNNNKKRGAKNVGLRLETTNLVALRHKAAVLITTLQNSLPGPPFSILTVAH
jgi:hypothetical protein